MVPFSAIAMSACAAPRIEVYTELVCLAHRPEYTVGDRNTIQHPTPIDTLSVSSAFQIISAVMDTNTNIADSFSYESAVQKDDRQRKCFEDPVVQAATAKLIAGEHIHPPPSPAPSPGTRSEDTTEDTCVYSLDYNYGCAWLPDDRMVGICKLASSFPIYARPGQSLIIFRVLS